MADDDNAFLIVEPDHQIVLITKYLNKEIRFDDLQASLELSRSNLRRRIKRFREMGPDGLKRKQRARGGNHHSPQFKDEVLAIVEERYPDFGPTFDAEKLLERHGLEITQATLLFKVRFTACQSLRCVEWLRRLTCHLQLLIEQKESYV